MTTLLEALTAKGIPDPKPRSIKQVQAAFNRQTVELKIPDDEAFGHRVMIERQSPLFHIGDPQQFSSRGLTDWYVAEFNSLNKLKGTTA